MRLAVRASRADALAGPSRVSRVLGRRRPKHLPIWPVLLGALLALGIASLAVISAFFVEFPA